MLALKSTTQLSLAETITLQGIPELDHYYAFDIENGDQFQLNQTAHWVLQAIGRGVDFQQLLENFIKTFGVDANLAQTDLSEIIIHAFDNQIIKEIVS